MNNITNYSHRKFDFKLSKRKIFDFQLADYDKRDEVDTTTNLIMDLNDEAGILISNTPWSEAVTGQYGITTFGLTAVDNGAVTYVDDTTFTLIHPIPERLELKPVAGFHPNQNIDYTISKTPDGHIRFEGGFYQGFYKLDGYDYQTLPNRFQKGWTIHTKLKPDSSIIESNTLNTLNPNNRGFFFYIGTRSENKYWNLFPGLNPESETVKETSYEGVIEEDFIIPLFPPRIVIKKMDNQFLIYGRSSGNTFCGKKTNFGFGTKTADDFVSGESLIYATHLPLNNVAELNPFLKYGRSSGYTFCGKKTLDQYGTKTADSDTSDFNLEEELDLYKDILDNALGFRIKDDGSIGYRRIITPIDCESLEKYEIKEEYSAPGIMMDQIWGNLTLKWVADKELECEFDEPRLGKLYVYVDGYLKHVFNDFKEIVNRELFEHIDKQIGVPYNISIGGGTQGLFESMTFDGPDPADQNLPLFTHFGGSFIGNMDGFKFYDNPLTWCEIKSVLI